MPHAVIPFTSPPGELNLATTCRDFTATALGQAAGMQVGATQTRFLYDCCVSLGRTFHMTIIFEGQRLARIDLELQMPGEKPGWENWSEQTERLRKEQGEQFLADLFHQPVQTLPLEIDGTSVMPFEQKWDNLKGFRFPWGEALSFFDSKGGFSGISLRLPAHPK